MACIALLAVSECEKTLTHTSDQFCSLYAHKEIYFIRIKAHLQCCELENYIPAGVIPAGGVGVQFAVSISSVEWKKLPEDCATKNPHLNESREFGYGVLENISIINKDGNGKNRV